MKSVQVNWGPVICDECETCICSTLVQYKKVEDTNFFTPSGDNPTQTTSFTLLNIEEGPMYEVLLTFIGPRCKQKKVSLALQLAQSSCCAEGFTLSPDGSYCYKIEEVNATAPAGSPAILVAKTANTFSSCGSFIYELGFLPNGTGASTKIPVITDVPSGQPSTLWVNGSGQCAQGFPTEGPLNRTAVWTPTTTNNQDVGFGVCVDAPESKQYYIAAAADNYVIINVDNQNIVTQNPDAFIGQYGGGNLSTFKVWHIYPVILEAGPHILEIIGHNIDSTAAVGCEVYNATADQLRACTNPKMLAQYTLFSSANMRGLPAQISTGGFGYTCPEGYTLAPCGDPVRCRKITTSEPITC